MNTRIIPALLGALLFSGVAEAAPSIYPVDTARFLGGSRFDFKVEFDGELAEKDAKVLINGQDASRSGRETEFIAKEKGPTLPRCCCAALRSTRDQYKVTVESPTGKASANWDVYGTPDKPVAKNVSLLIADGLSMGHRTSARPHVQRRDQRHVQRQAVDGHPALHRHARHMQRGFHRRRLRQHRLRLHDRAQVQREAPSGVYADRTPTRWTIPSRKPSPTAPPHDRPNPSAWFRTPKSRTRPRLPWSGIPAAAPTRPKSWICSTA